VNHPSFLPHLAAMTGLAQAVKSSDPILSSEALLAAKRQLKRYDTLMDQGDGSALSLALDLDSEQQFYLLLLDLLDDDRISPFWKVRLDQIDDIVLPGQEDLVDWTGRKEERKVHLIPLLRVLGQRLPSPEANQLASGLFLADRSFCGPWDFLGVVHAIQQAPRDIDHKFSISSFPASGLFTGRESRRPGSAQFIFRAGPPGGKLAYQAHLDGRPDLDFGHLLPDQGSFWWHHKGRLILGHQVMDRQPLTSDFNTLMIGHQGQVFEGYPRYAMRHWPKPAGGRVFLDEVHGHSWLLGAELKGAYAPEAGLESWVRLVLWVGPGILIQVDEVTLAREEELTFSYHSPQLPLSPKDNGFYQRISAMRMISKSFPQGAWDIADRGAVGQSVSFVATEKVKSKVWSRVNLMGPEAIVSDAWIERLEAGTGLDFQDKNMRFAYRLGDDGLKLSLKVRDKVFFDVNLDPAELKGEAL